MLNIQVFADQLNHLQSYRPPETGFPQSPSGLMKAQKSSLAPQVFRPHSFIHNFEFSKALKRQGFSNLVAKPHPN